MVAESSYELTSDQYNIRKNNSPPPIERRDLPPGSDTVLKEPPQRESDIASQDAPSTKFPWLHISFKKDKNTNWHKEYKKLASHTERLDQELKEIGASLRNKAIKLHQIRQSSFYDSLRTLEDSKPMVQALLNEYDNTLAKARQFEDDWRTERGRLLATEGQLRAKEGELSERWLKEKAVMERTQYERGQRDQKFRSDQELKKWEDHCDNLNTLKEKFENERAALEVDNEALEKKIEQADSKYISDMKDVEIGYCEKLSQAEQDLRNEKDNHVNEIRGIDQTHMEDLRRRQREHEHQMGILRKRLADQQKAFQSRVETMQESHDTAIGRLKREHKAEDEQLRQAMLALKQGHAAELDRREKQHNQDVLKMKREFKQIMSQRQAAYAATEKSLRDEIAGYSTALLARDKTDFNLADKDAFEPLTDTDIEARFADLVQDVDRLSRLDWKVDPKGWTAQDLHSLAADSNERLLKKQILQDSIWVLLHKYILCSPFRVFGEEGGSLEAQWNQECGAGKFKPLVMPAVLTVEIAKDLDNGEYCWPKPGVETERWRYITVRECRAALRQPVPSQWDPRAKLKKGFQASVEQVRKEITTAIGEVALLDKSSVQALEKMTARAARIWLEFGVQRCRIVIVVAGSNLTEVEAKRQNTREDGLDLVMIPKVKRFGNSKGEGLDTEETIAGREGETVRVVEKK